MTYGKFAVAPRFRKAMDALDPPRAVEIAARLIALEQELTRAGWNLSLQRQWHVRDIRGCQLPAGCRLGEVRLVDQRYRAAFVETGTWLCWVYVWHKHRDRDAREVERVCLIAGHCCQAEEERCR